MNRQQGDLFSHSHIAPREDQVRPRAIEPALESLSDAELLAAIPRANQVSCRGLAEEAVRRKLAAAVPALDALCRRFKGFGQRQPVAEQSAALQAIAAIGGTDAIAAIRRIITESVVAAPGLPEATRAAAALRCILPEASALALLQHPDPGIRAHACRCPPRTAMTIAALVSLLDDLNPGVAIAAAMALARMGRADGRAPLLRLVHRQPDPESMAALAAIARDEDAVLLGRIARTHPDLRQSALTALESIETPRAEAVLASLAQAGITAAPSIP